MTRKKIQQELSRLTKMVEAAWKEHEQKHDHENQEFLCPGIGSIGICTRTAVYLAARLRGKVYGYAIEDNPEAKVGRDEFGHDFAVVDDRWLVDFWAKDTYHLPALYDMHDPKQMAVVRRRYGDPARWQQMSDEDFERNKQNLG